MNEKSCQGQSLWEVIIALSIAGLIALGLVRATSSSVKSTRFSSDQSLMTARAQERMAQIINYKNQEPKKFWETEYFQLPPGIGENGDYFPEDDYCLLTRFTDLTSTLPAGTPNLAAAKMLKISVTIFWDRAGSGSQCENYSFNHQLMFETNVTN
jgi:Tfp pilus assembly protein PilV